MRFFANGWMSINYHCNTKFKQIRVHFCRLYVMLEKIWNFAKKKVLINSYGDKEVYHHDQYNFLKSLHIIFLLFFPH